MLVPGAGFEPASLAARHFKCLVYTIPPSGQKSDLFEARVGIEPTHKSFADSCLTT